ncbi:sigma factor-like helix-turn-helix DNA-binding protein [Paenibacillus lautus]|uniref:RNA polymerase sigma factor n=1 Tax=Paenibacillus lautus TaxID=1401 RepID=UPI002DB8B50B|nr:sigma factor-like helix-turn-helix DNA-binding protein [Paenibacillus lautus]MEC0203995.1 sigma factor-like helix-turn-helix DNA-binding protein [Paenibacillus lautus]
MWQNREENRDELLSAVLTLPETLRQPMYLYYYEDFNTLEIAEVLQMEAENVRNRLSRAHKKLKGDAGGEAGSDTGWPGKGKKSCASVHLTSFTVKFKYGFSLT